MFPESCYRDPENYCEDTSCGKSNDVLTNCEVTCTKMKAGCDTFVKPDESLAACHPANEEYFMSFATDRHWNGLSSTQFPMDNTDWWTGNSVHELWQGPARQLANARNLCPVGCGTCAKNEGTPRGTASVAAGLGFVEQYPVALGKSIVVHDYDGARIACANLREGVQAYAGEDEHFCSSDFCQGETGGCTKVCGDLCVVSKDDTCTSPFSSPSEGYCLCGGRHEFRAGNNIGDWDAGRTCGVALAEGWVCKDGPKGGREGQTGGRNYMIKHCCEPLD